MLQKDYPTLCMLDALAELIQWYSYTIAFGIVAM